MKQLQRYKTGNNEVSFACGNSARVILPYRQGKWTVEYREGAKFAGRQTFKTAREALIHARRGRQPFGRDCGYQFDQDKRHIAEWLWNGLPSVSVDALQNYINRCQSRGLRVNLDAFSQANARAEGKQGSAERAGETNTDAP